jgi:hypothetical protein
MRDGIKLHTVIYSPNDDSQAYPILLVRTPYSAEPHGMGEFHPVEKLAPSEDFVKDGYIFVFQDVRGTFNSEGQWVNLRPVNDTPDDRPGTTDETTDAYDTIEWLVENVSNNNGRVGMWGISHPGWYTLMGIVNPHPALKAASPQAPTFDAFIGDDDHHNGAFNLMGVEWWYAMSIVSGPGRQTLNGKWPEAIEFPTAWPYEFYLNAGPTDELNKTYFGNRLTQVWDNILEHPNYDEFWQRRNLRHLLGDTEIPLLNVATWFDVYDPYGAFETYRTIEELNPDNQSILVSGPWSHGGWHYEDGSRLGSIHFGSNPTEYYQERVVFPFFQYHLKGKGHWRADEAVVFETGKNRWHHLPSWPPKGVSHENIYLHHNGRLAFEAPESNGDLHDAYVSDPHKPVPYTDEIRRDRGAKYMVGDQRYSSTRPDVLTYQTDPLQHDITIAGPVLVNLFASTSGTDSDWFVKLIDAHPGQLEKSTEGQGQALMAGYQMLVGYEVMRSKYRNSFSNPEPMVPDEPAHISFNIWDKFHTFRKGHRIMVQIHSSWFPVFDRNPQTFTDIYRARDSHYRKARQNVYRSNDMPSHLVLPVVDVLIK